MKIYFLEAAVPLTKSYRKTGSELVKAPYPLVTEVTSHEVVVADLKAFEVALKHHAALGHCLLKGVLSRDLVSESRAGTTTTDAQTDWICLDIDGLPATYLDANGKAIPITVDGLLADLGLGDVSYVLQWSASYGIESTDLRAHIFIQLAKPLAAPLLKQWLVQLNIESQILYPSLKLTKTGNAISWGLDISTCQNDKLIYITPPVLKGIKDPMGKTPRVTYTKKAKAKLTIDPSTISLAKNTDRSHNILNELRLAAGLPKRKNTFKTVGTVEVMVKPDACIITERKQERGFVYFNLNGGDSWGYYHPETNPDYIYNFKGEPTYLTKELLPDYWTEIHSQKTAQGNANIVDSAGLMKMAFLDPATDKYWRGTYDTKTDTLNLESTASLTALRHYAKANGIIFNDEVVPEWRLVFDPHDNVRVDTANATVNLFQPTEYMRAVAKQVNICPKTIKRVIHHALGSDDEAFDRFINWLAYVLQVRDVALTAWIFHGTEGTGKGTLLNRILKPLFGREHVAIPRMSELEKEFNGFIDRSLLVVVDEFEAAALQSEKGVMADIKRYITEQHVPLRRMHRDSKTIRNYSAWIFNSNSNTSVTVPRGDRRFNVGKFQPNKLIITDAELAKIDKELQAFHDYLLYFQVNKDQVYTPLLNQERDELMELTENAVDAVVNALTGGSMAHFIDALPTDTRYVGNAQDAARVNDYKSVVGELLKRTDRNTGVCNVARDEMKVLFTYLVGKTIPDSPNKFTSLLKHHRMRMTKVRVDGVPVNGAQITWLDLADWSDYLNAVAPPQVVAAKKAVKLARVK